MTRKLPVFVKLLGLALVAVLGVMTNIGSIDSGGNGEGIRGLGNGQLFVVAEGTEMVLISMNSDGHLFEIDRAGIPTAGLLTEAHFIFGITKHPTENILYVTSLNNYIDDVAQWGNARIDRFSYNTREIKYEGLAFAYDTDSGPDCADQSPLQGASEEDVVGTCAPTTAAFSSDGLRLYVDDDKEDVVQIFQVDPDNGDLTFLWEGSDTNYNGLTVSPNDDYLYNGESVFEIDGDTVSISFNGQEGNATEVVQNGTGDNLLATTINNNESLAIYDLTDQSNPTLIDSIVIPTVDELSYYWNDDPARYQDSSDDISLFVVVGVESVATVGFDGSEFTLLDQVFDDDDTYDVMNRGVALSPDGRYALVTWFIPVDPDENPLFTGGYTVYAIAEDGTLSEVETIELAVPSRVVLRL